MKEAEGTVEHEARDAWNRGDMKAAATLVYDAYGMEIYSFLLAQFRESSRADDVFSQFNEDFWCGLPFFEWRCSMRAWCYRLARSAASRYRRAPYNRPARRVPVSTAPCFEAIVHRARTSTRPHLKSEVKDQFHQLRQRLTDDERELLILRVDRNMPWREVAHAMLSDEQPTDDETVRRKEAALRQQYVELKKRLKALAIELGLLDPNDGR